MKTPADKSNKKKFVQYLISEMLQGRTDIFYETLADDVRLTIIGSTPVSGTHVGKEAFQKEYMGKIMPLLKSIKFHHDLFIGEGDNVVVTFRGEGLSIKGEPYNNSYCYIYRFKNDKIAEIIEYTDTALINKLFESNIDS